MPPPCTLPPDPERMTLSVEMNATLYPLDIKIRDPYAAVLATNPLGNAIRKLGRLRHGRIKPFVWEA